MLDGNGFSVTSERRNRRTSSSTRRQSMACRWKAASSGPFTTTVVAASNLSFGSGASVIFLFTGSPDRVSTLSRPGARPGIRPVIRDRRLRGAGHHVPVSCCVSAAGLCFSAIRFPPRDWAFLTVGLPDVTARTSTGVTTFRAHELRAGWVPPVPRGQRCSSRLSGLPSRRLPLGSGESLHSATASHRRS